MLLLFLTALFTTYSTFLFTWVNTSFFSPLISSQSTVQGNQEALISLLSIGERSVGRRETGDGKGVMAEGVWRPRGRRRDRSWWVSRERVGGQREKELGLRVFVCLVSTSPTTTPREALSRVADVEAAFLFSRTSAGQRKRKPGCVSLAYDKTVTRNQEYH